MASSPNPVMPRHHEVEQLITAIHGNCVFSDAEYPVHIDHLPGCAVVSGTGHGTTTTEHQSTTGDQGPIGKIHFPLPGPMDLGSGNVSGIKWVDLEVDFMQYRQGREVPVGNGGELSRVIKAEVFVGCHLVWSKDLNDADSFKVLLNDFMSREEKLPGKGLEVTLTIKFGEDSLKFCSVALQGRNVNKRPPKPEGPY
ncbi:hypothetical protein DL767_000740 [Monosporascus sp. MG133]|nr:hypothetical protein DL767_000740 [Monosporascus sp. MG133]